MKKLLLKLITLLLAAVIGVAFVSGCNLVTEDTERNLNQVVATVNINKKENITKKDLIVGYMNYGYIYTQYYGYDVARTYKIILNGLIENRIVVQVATDIFEHGDAELGIAAKIENDTPAPNAKRYLTEDEITEAKYAAYKAINDLLDSYSEDKSKTEIKDTLIFDVRTVPTDAKNADKTDDIDYKRDYVADIESNGFDVNGEYSRPAFNKVVKLLKTNDLLGDKYDGTLMTTEYLNQLLKNYYENQLIANYEEAILQGIKDSLTYEKLEASYLDKLDEQKEWSNKEFTDALSSASATSPIVYSNQAGKYGYVYNLLLGINDYQSKQIEDLQEDREHEHLSEADYAARRKDILEGTIAEDLRSSWILSGYDYDFATNKFTGDYTFAKGADNSLEFKGTVREVRAKTDDKDAVYAVESVITYGLEEFTAFVNGYVYNNESLIPAATNENIYAAYTRDDKPAEYDAKINELLFAFSTDPGSLNTYKGYVIKPDNNEYVKTFGDAGKALLDAGGSSYTVVASDYGYHFMFFSEVWTANDEYATLADYLDTLGIDKGGAATWAEYFDAQKANWEDFEEENNFLYFLANELISAKLSAKSSQSRTVLLNTYRYNEKYTTVYESVYSDLIG